MCIISKADCPTENTSRKEHLAVEDAVRLPEPITFLDPSLPVFLRSVYCLSRIYCHIHSENSVLNMSRKLAGSLSYLHPSTLQASDLYTPHFQETPLFFLSDCDRWMSLYLLIIIH